MDILKKYISCLSEDNKKLVEEIDKKEAELQDCEAKLKELEKSLDLEKVIIILIVFRCY